MKRIRSLVWAFLAIAMSVAAASPGHAETARESANRKAVTGYFAALDRLETLGPDAVARELPAILARYCRADYIQHNSGMAQFGQGTAGLLRMFESQAKSRSARPAPGASHVITVMAQGDMVVRINTRERPGGAPPVMIFNLFRMEGGRIAEHWDGLSGGVPG